MHTRVRTHVHMCAHSPCTHTHTHSAPDVSLPSSNGIRLPWRSTSALPPGASPLAAFPSRPPPVAEQPMGSGLQVIPVVRQSPAGASLPYPAPRATVGRMEGTENAHVASALPHPWENLHPTFRDEPGKKDRKQ